jgi:ELWxxDGT repeat protein
MLKPIVLIFLVALYSVNAHCQEIFVKNINHYPNNQSGSSPVRQVNFKGKVFFVADDKIHGTELWCTDGTEAGTFMVKDIHPGIDDSDPVQLTVGDSLLYFKANDGSGYEIWKSDGTSSGTTLLKDIIPNPNASDMYLASLMTVGDSLYFISINTQGFDETDLYVSDGTEAGTELIKHFDNYAMESDALCYINGFVYFPGKDNTHYIELWKTDGTQSGTVMVKDIQPGINASSSPINLCASNDVLYFAAYNSTYGYELWKSDGTENGTVLVKDVNTGTASSNPDELFDANGIVYFEANNTLNGYELWKSDGTSSGTEMVKDLQPGSETSYPGSFTLLNDVLYFVCTTSANGKELWQTNGSTSGTTIVKDIYAGMWGSVEPPLYSLHGKLYFSANDGIHGDEVWRSDGTAAGTEMIDDLWPGFQGSATVSFGGTADSIIITTANNGYYGKELFGFKSNDDTIKLVKDINSEEGDSYLQNFTASNGLMFFSGYNAIDGTALYRSDGTDTGTYLIQDYWPDNQASADMRHLMLYNNELFFTSFDSTGVLWKTDGTIPGTSMVTSESNALSDIMGSNSPYTLYHWMVHNGYLYFVGAPNYELWRTDGTNSGTIELTDLGVGDPTYLAPLHNNLYFLVWQATSGLYETNGTVSGTDKVYSFPYPTDGRYLINMNDVLYFGYNDDDNGYELWKSNGTANGTVMLKDINPSGSSDPEFITPANCNFYFKADNGTKGAEPWISDGTTSGTKLLKDINSGSASSDPHGFVVAGNTVFFWADDGIHGMEVWKTDGTAAGTSMTKDVFQGTGNWGEYLVAIPGADGICYFTSSDTMDGHLRLYRTDGTEAGTYAVTSDSFSLIKPFVTNCFGYVNGTIFMYGGNPNDPAGEELYKIPVPESNSGCTVSLCSICSGTTLDVTFNFIGSAVAGNIYTAQLSDSTGSFNNPVDIGSLTSVASMGSISCTIPMSIPTGLAYQIRIVRSSPAAISASSFQNLKITQTIEWFPDLDDDDYGDPGSSVTICQGNPPAGYVTDSTDCNDDNSDIHPGVIENLSNGIDDDCDGLIDEFCSADFSLVADTLIPHHYFLISEVEGVAPINYVWSWGDGSTDTIAYPSHSYDTAGFYNICLFINDATGCTDSSCVGYELQKSEQMNTIITVDVVDSIPDNSTGIANESVIQSFSIYPNPTSQNVFVGYSLSTAASVTIELYDVLGNKLREISNDFDKGQHSTTIDVQKFSGGVYYLKIRTDEQIISGKIVIMK